MRERAIHDADPSTKSNSLGAGGHKQVQPVAPDRATPVLTRHHSYASHMETGAEREAARTGSHPRSGPDTRRRAVPRVRVRRDFHWSTSESGGQKQRDHSTLTFTLEHHVDSTSVLDSRRYFTTVAALAGL